MRIGGVAIVTAAIALAGCSFGQDIASTGKAIDDFHASLNRDQIAIIYDGSNSDMKNATSATDFSRFMTAIHTKLGAFKSGRSVGWNENANPAGTFVVINYSAKYAKGDAAEVFTFKMAGGKPVLSGYNINSRALIVN